MFHGADFGLPFDDATLPVLFLLNRLLEFAQEPPDPTPKNLFSDLAHWGTTLGDLTLQCSMQSHEFAIRARPAKPGIFVLSRAIYEL